MAIASLTVRDYTPATGMQRNLKRRRKCARIRRHHRGVICAGRLTGADVENCGQFGATYSWGIRRTAEGWKIASREMVTEWKRPNAK